MKKTLIAFGGNAILPAKQKGSYEEQLANIRICCEKIVELAKEDHTLIITHGNGPQVGNLLIQNELAKDQIPGQPLHACVSQTQGQLGCMIQCELDNQLERQGLDLTSASIITRVLVDKEDLAFSACTKPIGPFFSEEYAQERLKTGESWLNDSGRGWRRLVPSPYPQKILELETIRMIMEQGTILVAAGGGGVPVIKRGGQIVGVDAVIDKDLASALLAKELKMDTLVLLTDVDQVKLNFNQANEKSLDIITCQEAERYIAQGQFGLGSMAPKIEAALDFVRKNEGKAIITSFKYLLEAIRGQAGTRIIAQ